MTSTRRGWFLVAPACVLLMCVGAYPVAHALWLSTQRYRFSQPGDRAFVGFANYEAVLSDQYWWRALWVTVLITVVSVAFEFVLGLALALLMHRTLVGKSLVRTLVLIPYGMVTVVSAYSWLYAWTPGTGYLANLLPQGSAPLTQQGTSIAAIILAEVWKTSPFMSLLLLTGLAQVPQDMTDAAQMDGAGALTRLFRVVLPAMKPAIMVALLFRAVDAFRVFDNIYVMTKGAAGTGSVSLLGYDNLFLAFNFGTGSAISVLVFVCVALIVAVFMRIFGASAPGLERDR
ncbi:binding-protein-dependent transport systems inner membrane component [Segniliparus rotundus DSM 44985]|uniref:Binding-protein-dependent transport systems inner membrane component n=1 Tax=Segniliparus rotundus (strain ATCC BAA-972 / CDC 1076 / CIP 108378 / DSM 44985 / JCM 13578) TaxID=640132 RepID=D6Z9A8_SEGRD|nr:sugar ABC transporter permease [Segniliparus rotundus]ADG98538.1 binding-protein-dependent transport systems inner membrane component [Segniliparus rotundus DSM 44985]